MSINARHLRAHVIRPALEAIDLWSPTAEDLVLGTAAAESRCGHYLVQVGGGPALGIFQMEPATHDDIWENYIDYRPALCEELENLASTRPDEGGHVRGPLAEELIWNLLYAAAMCRIHYRRVPVPLPAHGDVKGYGLYWKLHYNTPLGAGTVEKFVKAWDRYAVL